MVQTRTEAMGTGAHLAQGMDMEEAMAVDTALWAVMAPIINHHRGMEVAMDRLISHQSDMEVPMVHLTNLHWGWGHMAPLAGHMVQVAWSHLEKDTRLHGRHSCSRSTELLTSLDGCLFSLMRMLRHCTSSSRPCSNCLTGQDPCMGSWRATCSGCWAGGGQGRNSSHRESRTDWQGTVMAINHLTLVALLCPICMKRKMCCK